MYCKQSNFIKLKKCNRFVKGTNCQFLTGGTTGVEISRHLINYDFLCHHY
jgi:hypothetical protein